MPVSSRRGGSRQSSNELPVGLDARKVMLDFYRERDREDAERCASGQQKSRGAVWAAGVTRLESAEDVYESYRVLRAAGIELPTKTVAAIEALPQDWKQVCRIDCEGRLWTASLREKKSYS